MRWIYRPFFCKGSTGCAYALTGYNNASNSPHILTARSSSIGGVLKEYYVDSGDRAINTGVLDNTLSANYYIGRHANLYSTGIISELIMFDRALSDFEREEVENYLSKKWGIKLNR